MPIKNIDANIQIRLVKVLERVTLFSSLSLFALQRLAATMDTRFVQNDSIIFVKGDIADTLYIIQSGKVLIYQPNSSNNVGEKIAVLIENDFFGEMGLVGQKPRNASAKTLEDSILFVLTKDDFYSLLNEHADVASEIMETYMQRTKNNQKREFIHAQAAKKPPQWDVILGQMIDS